MTKETKIAVIEKNLNPIVEGAHSLVIKDPRTMTKATEMLSKVNKYLDQAIEEKEKVTKPLNEALKAERGRWKPLETVCEEAVGIIKRKMTDYQTEQKRIADEAAAKIAARVGDGKGKLQGETAARKIGEIEKPSEKVESDSGKVKFKTVKKFEVMDITMVPYDFLLANESAIKQAMNDGVEVAGVRYYTEEVPSNFR